MPSAPKSPKFAADPGVGVDVGNRLTLADIAYKDQSKKNHTYTGSRSSKTQGSSSNGQQSDLEWVQSAHVLIDSLGSSSLMNICGLSTPATSADTNTNTNSTNQANPKRILAAETLFSDQQSPDRSKRREYDEYCEGKDWDKEEGEGQANRETSRILFHQALEQGQDQGQGQRKGQRQGLQDQERPHSSPRLSTAQVTQLLLAQEEERWKPLVRRMQQQLDAHQQQANAEKDDAVERLERRHRKEQHRLKRQLLKQDFGGGSSSRSGSTSAGRTFGKGSDNGSCITMA